MMTDLQILDQVITTLDGIEIPAKYVEKIGIPISNSSNMLKALRRAVREVLRKKAEEEGRNDSGTPTVADPMPESEESEPIEEMIGPIDELIEPEQTEESVNEN